jgi:hypothetical protein
VRPRGSRRARKARSRRAPLGFVQYDYDPEEASERAVGAVLTGSVKEGQRLRRDQVRHEPGSLLKPQDGASLSW